MKQVRIVFIALLFFGITSVSAPIIGAQQPDNKLEYQTATVQEIIFEEKIEVENKVFYVQEVLVVLPDKSTKTINVGSEFQPLTEEQRLVRGSSVIVALDTNRIAQDGEAEELWVLADVYRLPVLAGLGLLFLIVVTGVAGWQGLRSTGGMVLSLVGLALIVVPAILAGWNPLLVSLVAGTCIAGVTIYVSHGFSITSHVSLFSLLVTLGFVAALAFIFVRGATLVGLGSEEAYFLQFGESANINLQGLLLAGIILGALGVLDDITISQVSIVFELWKANPKLTMIDLYERAMVVGKHHVASLVNTLVMAYASANMPLFILFHLNEFIPGWVMLNNEMIAEEVVRTLVGSIGLVLAVPIATFCAAWVVMKWPKSITDSEIHAHTHKH